MLTRRAKLRKTWKATWNALSFQSTDAVPVFIFGEMRSGTNMLTQCLDKCIKTTIFNESDDEAFTGYVLKENSTIEKLIDDCTSTHVVFKCLADSARAIELLHLFPNAKAIWIYRNFEDVVNSALMKWSEHNKYLHYVLYDRVKAGWRVRNLPDSLINLIRQHYERGLSEPSARALIWYVRNKLFFTQALFARDEVHLVRYENLVRQPSSELQATFDFLDLNLKSSYYKHISTRSISRHDSPDIDATILDLCASLLRELDQHSRSGDPVDQANVVHT